MTKLRVHCFSVSLDGFGAGPQQDRDNPLGVRGLELHTWLFATQTSTSSGGAKGTASVDEDFARRSTQNIGAWIMGRNMFGPIRGPWENDQWRGWWGDEPPFHVPVFVLSHHRRESFQMKGGTTFHFVTGGIEEALQRAREAARPKDILLGGGVETIRQYLRAQLVDEMHLAVTPIVLGSGESLLSGLDLIALGYDVTERVASESAMHVVLTRREHR
jgi:dihydrofolate reductase